MKINLEQYKILEEKVKNRDSYIRLGQAWFNELYMSGNPLSEDIRSTDNDPFYNDSKLGKFFKAICDDECLKYLIYV